MNRPLIRAAALAAALLFASQALPQDSSQPSAPPTAAQQADRLRQSLKLRPDQEGALQTFVTAMQPNAAEAVAQREEAQRDAALPTPQRLDAMIARLDRYRVQVLAKIAAIRAFYGQLSPAQKQSFDATPSLGH